MNNCLTFIYILLVESTTKTSSEKTVPAASAQSMEIDVTMASGHMVHTTTTKTSSRIPGLKIQQFESEPKVRKTRDTEVSPEGDQDLMTSPGGNVKAYPWTSKKRETKTVEYTTTTSRSKIPQSPKMKTRIPSLSDIREGGRTTQRSTYEITVNSPEPISGEFSQVVKSFEIPDSPKMWMKEENRQKDTPGKVTKSSEPDPLVLKSEKTSRTTQRSTYEITVNSPEPISAEFSQVTKTFKMPDSPTLWSKDDSVKREAFGIVRTSTKIESSTILASAHPVAQESSTLLASTPPVTPDKMPDEYAATTYFIENPPTILAHHSPKKRNDSVSEDKDPSACRPSDFVFRELPPLLPSEAHIKEKKIEQRTVKLEGFQAEQFLIENAPTLLQPPKTDDINEPVEATNAESLKYLKPSFPEGIKASVVENDGKNVGDETMIIISQTEKSVMLGNQSGDMDSAQADILKEDIENNNKSGLTKHSSVKSVYRTNVTEGTVVKHVEVDISETGASTIRTSEQSK